MTKIYTFLLFLSAFSTHAQYTWQSFSELKFEDEFSSPLVWEHKDKVWVFTDEKNLETYKNAQTDLLVPFVGKGDVLPKECKEVVQWTTDDALWLFGGIATEDGKLQDDLWRYKIEEDLWSIIKSDGSKPSARAEALTWTDSEGNLWLFGGKTDDVSQNSLGLSNELWAFNIKENNWTLHTVKTAPSPRVNAAIWNAASGRVLLN